MPKYKFTIVTADGDHNLEFTSENFLVDEVERINKRGGYYTYENSSMVFIPYHRIRLIRKEEIDDATV